jgi:hypothetical protein
MFRVGKCQALAEKLVSFSLGTKTGPLGQPSRLVEVVGVGLGGLLLLLGNRQFLTEAGDINSLSVSHCTRILIEQQKKLPAASKLSGAQRQP